MYWQISLELLKYYYDIYEKCTKEKGGARHKIWVEEERQKEGVF